MQLRLGTRRSALALAQSGMMARALEQRHPGLSVELVPMVTTGDVVKGDLAEYGGKGLFTEELERGLLDGSLDLAVHSLKDLPVRLPEGLVVAAHPERADPRDALVSEAAVDIDSLPAGATVLTGALRRRAQILLRRPDLEVVPIRGNVDTRLRKWREQKAGGVILAAAGLERLGLRDLPIHPVSPEILIPAPCQGTLALEVRAGSRAEELVRALDHPATARAAQAERHVVAAFGGNCTLPLAAWAREEDGRLRLTALLATPDGSLAARGEAVGDDPVAVAEDCVEVMRAGGANEILARLGT
jgi:hydroxymethylbilane synthase